jgi:hypothetical protein
MMVASGALMIVCPRARQSVRGLGVHDRPRLVQAVDVRTGRQGRLAAFVEAAADAEVAVRERHHRL